MSFSSLSKQFSTAFLFFTLLAVSPMVAAGDSEPQPKTCYDVLSSLYLPSLAQQSKQEKAELEEIEKYNAAVIKAHEKKAFRLKLHPSIDELKQIPIGQVEKLNITYKLFALNNETPASAINTQPYQDLEFFCGYNSNPTHHILSQFDTTTTMGSIELQKLLALPITDIETLQKRQTFILELISNPALLSKLEKHLLNLKKLESDFLFFWKTVDSANSALYDKHFFTWLTKLNQNEAAIEVPTLWNLIGLPTLPFTCFAGILAIVWAKEYAQGGEYQREHMRQEIYEIPSNVASFFGNLPMYAEGAFIAIKDHPYMSAYVASLAATYFFPTISNAVEHNKETNIFQQKMIYAADYSNTLQTITQTLHKNTAFAELFSDEESARTNISEKLQELQALLATNTFKGEPSVFSIKGKALAAFNIMLEIKDQYAPLLKEVGQIDAFVAVAKRLKATMTNPNAQFCFAEYEVADKPHVALTDFWHPILNQDTVVTNNFEFGGQDKASNITITGPNAGGKSTILKGLTVSIMLAQTLGIAPATRMVLTPFTQISTYLNISDAAGTASLYQAEMRRAQALIKSIQALDKNQFSFIIMDEIFTGTNPDEGQSGAYGIAKSLAKFDNSMCVLATHFKLLTELESAIPGKFKNYKVTVVKQADGSFKMPYKLAEGATDQQIALELLQQEGFSDDIVQEAQAQLAKIQHQKARTK